MLVLAVVKAPCNGQRLLMPSLNERQAAVARLLTAAETYGHAWPSRLGSRTVQQLAQAWLLPGVPDMLQNPHAA